MNDQQVIYRYTLCCSFFYFHYTQLVENFAIASSVPISSSSQPRQYAAVILAIFPAAAPIRITALDTTAEELITIARESIKMLHNKH